MAVTEVSIANRRSRTSSFFELTKPRITFMVLIATAVGFYMGSPENIRMLLLIHTIVGTGLIAAGYFFMQGGNNNFAFKSIALYGILGLVFFLAGVGLVRSTRDKAT
jgi:hypothetical protein